MKTWGEIRTIIGQIQYKDWKFELMAKGDGFLVQVVFSGTDVGTGKIEVQKGRKWYISKYSCDSEVIRTVFLAIRQAEEHEMCENFIYDGQQVFNPHVHMDKLAEFMSSAPFETREAPNKPIN